MSVLKYRPTFEFTPNVQKSDFSKFKTNESFGCLLCTMYHCREGVSAMGSSNPLTFDRARVQQLG
jgi:hypothetical protein